METLVRSTAKATQLVLVQDGDVGNIPSSSFLKLKASKRIPREKHCSFTAKLHADESVQPIAQKLTYSRKGAYLEQGQVCIQHVKTDFHGILTVQPRDRANSIACRSSRRCKRASKCRGGTKFSGLVNFSARFIPNLASIAEPLPRLTRKQTPFVWGTEQQGAFDALKDSLANAETLAYFDSNAEETKLITDASPVGLGAVLTQVQGGCERVVAYASRSLTDVERRYSQTEKEALGLVWGCERFHMYLYGVEFTLLTDHNPLEVIYSTNSLNSARTECWVLRLQPYRLKVQ